MSVLEQIVTALILIMKGLLSLSIIAFVLCGIGPIVLEIIKDKIDNWRTKK